MLRNSSPADLHCSYCHLLYRWRAETPGNCNYLHGGGVAPTHLTGDLKQTQELLLSCPQPPPPAGGLGQTWLQCLSFLCSRHEPSSGAGWINEMPSERPGRFSRHWGWLLGAPGPTVGSVPPDSWCSKPVCPSSGSEGLSSSVDKGGSLWLQ